jgi:hypothetical protein
MAAHRTWLFIIMHTALIDRTIEEQKMFFYNLETKDVIRINSMKIGTICDNSEQDGSAKD